MKLKLRSARGTASANPFSSSQGFPGRPAMCPTQHTKSAERQPVERAQIEGLLVIGPLDLPSKLAAWKHSRVHIHVGIAFGHSF